MNMSSGMPMNGTTNGTIDGTTGMSEISSNLGRVPAILGIAFSLTVTMIVVVVLRIFLRLNNGIKSVRLVDWLHVIAGLSSVAVSVMVIIAVRFGAGRHRFDVSSSDTIQGLKFYWISKLLYIAATWVVKLAIFASLLLVASAPPQQGRKFLKKLLYVGMMFMTAYSVVFWITALIECRPTRFIFDKTSGGQCLPGHLIKGMSNAHAAMNTAMDLFFVLLPVFMVIYGVRRSMREKLALVGVFLLAFFAVAAAAVHTLYEFGYGETNEVLFDQGNLIIWAMVEINIGLIAINLPALSPLFRNFLQPKRSPNRNSNLHFNSPATPTPSTLLGMTTADELNRSESQRNIVDPPAYPLPARPAPPFAVGSSQARFSSDSKTNLSEIMVQMDLDMEEHPAFRERERPVATGDGGRTGHRRMPTPMF